MNTGVTDWAGAAEFGAVYPFVGLEMLLFIAGIVLWVGWHICQIAGENKEYREALRHYKEVGLDKVLDHTGNQSAAVGSGGR